MESQVTPGAKILVIDDESGTRTMLAVELEKAGYSVFKADDGEVGLQVVRAAKPDLIICDVLMPNMDGNKFLKALREREYSRDIPVIIISARGQMKDYFMMMDVDDFIAKPFHSDDVLMRIGRILKKKKNLQQPIKEDSGPAPERTPAEAGSAPGIKKKVLLLDDDADMTVKYERLLKENYYEVKLTKTVRECLDVAMTFKPDLIALRYMTDRAGGENSLVKIKEVPHVRNIPFMVYGNDIDEPVKEQILEDGAEFFVHEATDAKILQAVKKMVG